MAAPLINPPLPLLSPIPGGFLHGKIVRIQGAVGPSPQRFAINLQCGPNLNPRDDLALHLSPRFSERVIARNSLVCGQWGQEERHGPSFPFNPNQGFEILLLADSSHYKIAINGQHFAEFHFRTPAERVTYLSADGDLTISMVSFEGQGFSTTPGHPHMPTPAPPMPVHPQPGMPPMPVPGMPTPGYGINPPGQMPYPTTGSGHQPYPPAQPGVPYPPQPGMNPYPSAGYPSQPGYGQYPPGSKKAAKQQRKAQKKALKYGLPIAGVGLGAYALHKGMKHHGGFHHGSSSSSSSSSSEEE